MSKRAVDINPGTEITTNEDGSATATFTPLGLVGHGPTEQEARDDLIKAIMAELQYNEDAQAKFTTYAEANSTEMLEDDTDDLKSRSKAATAGFTVLDSSCFDATISADDLPVLVDFWADWCTPCHMLAPTLKELSDDLSDRMRIAKLNIDENIDIAQRFHVQSIPTIILFHRGEEKHRITGSGRPKEEYAAELLPHL